MKKIVSSDQLIDALNGSINKKGDESAQLLTACFYYLEQVFLQGGKDISFSLEDCEDCSGYWTEEFNKIAADIKIAKDDFLYSLDTEMHELRHAQDSYNILTDETNVTPDAVKNARTYYLQTQKLEKEEKEKYVLCDNLLSALSIIQSTVSANEQDACLFASSNCLTVFKEVYKKYPTIDNLTAVLYYTDLHQKNECGVNSFMLNDYHHLLFVAASRNEFKKYMQTCIAAYTIKHEIIKDNNLDKLGEYKKILIEKYENKSFAILSHIKEDFLEKVTRSSKFYSAKESRLNIETSRQQKEFYDECYEKYLIQIAGMKAEYNAFVKERKQNILNQKKVRPNQIADFICSFARDKRFGADEEIMNILVKGKHLHQIIRVQQFLNRSKIETANIMASAKCQSFEMAKLLEKNTGASASYIIEKMADLFDEDFIHKMANSTYPPKLTKKQIKDFADALAKKDIRNLTMLIGEDYFNHALRPYYDACVSTIREHDILNKGSKFYKDYLTSLMFGVALSEENKKFAVKEALKNKDFELAYGDLKLLISSNLVLDADEKDKKNNLLDTIVRVGGKGMINYAQNKMDKTEQELFCKTIAEYKKTHLKTAN